MLFLKSFDSENIGYQVIYQPQNSTENLVIVPGFGGDINFLSHFLESLKRLNPQACIYFFNPRGHSYSSKNFPEGEIIVDDVHAQDFSAFIKHLNLKSYIVIGHSYGGVIFQNYLNLSNSLKPKKFFLVCSAPKISGFPNLKKIFYKLLSKLPDSKKPFSYQAPQFYQKLAQSQDINLERWVHDTHVTGGTFPWFLHFLSISGWQNKNLETLNQEIGYYLYGKKDIIIPKATQMKYLKKLSKINSIEINSGHLAPINNPEELAKIISTHI